MPGYDGLIPPELIAGITPETRPPPSLPPTDAPPEPHYRPSPHWPRVRARDLTCRWPTAGARRNCDIDHGSLPRRRPHPPRQPRPASAAFITSSRRSGAGTRVHPDGTMAFTSPTGTTATTRPAGAAIYPTLAVPTASISAPPPGAARTFTDKGCKMPRRSTTRAKQRAAAIAAERSANQRPHQPPPALLRRGLHLRGHHPRRAARQTATTTLLSGAGYAPPLGFRRPLAASI